MTTSISSLFHAGLFREYDFVASQHQKVLISVFPKCGLPFFIFKINLKTNKTFDLILMHVSFINYRKSKTILKSTLNSHMYWTPLFEKIITQSFFIMN